MHRIYRRVRIDVRDRIPSDRKIRSVLTQWLTHLGYKNAVVEISLVSDPAIRRVNAEFRGKNKPTDVLSFPAQEFTRTRVPRLVSDWPQTGPLPLGDIMISIPTARRQAREIGHSVQDEFYRLLSHGVLHLLGYDHERSRAEEKRMIAREDELTSFLWK